MADYYAVRNSEIEQLLKELGGFLKTQMPENWGFTLLIFNFEKKEKSTSDGIFYISSARREDMIKAMKEFIETEAKFHAKTKQ